MNLVDKVIIVTGSSKGLGLALTQQLLEEGSLVVGISRSKTSISHHNFTNIQADVSNEKEIQAAVDEIIDKYNNIYAIINNAGFGHYASVEETDSALLSRMFEVNVFGIFNLIRSVLPSMKKAQKGHIINISSIAGIMGVEKMSAYNATKFAVKGMSESLFKELRPHGIKVTCILPGSISTNFFDDLEGFTTSNTMMNPKDVADSIIHCLKSPGTYHPVNLEIRPFSMPH